MRAPRGTTLTARSWQTEAPLRMLQNNLDPDVAERPDDLVVYGGTGRAARDWASYDALVRTLTTLEGDETLLVQSGRPVGVLRTHEWAPRVLIANSNLVGDWATWPEFRRLERLGLTMYGQMTAGSWIYIGTQGILQGTYETFAAVADKRFEGTLRGTLTVTGGCGGMGGAQPLAVTLNGGVCLVVDVAEWRLRRRVQTRYLDELADSLDDAVERCLRAKAAGEAVSVGLVGNCAAVLPELLRRGVEVDIVTDQTSAHDPLAYLPDGVDLDDWDDYARTKPDEFTDRARESMARHVEAMVGFLDGGAEVFDYGNSIRDEARQGGYDRAFAFPGFVPAYIRPLFCAGKGPFRWAALSGDPADIAATDEAVLELFPDDDKLQRWIRAAREKVAFQGLPARICWLGHGERDRAGLRFNELVASGAVTAPIVIGRDHLDAGSVASPYRETEAMADGSDAIADWPLLNALVNTASGATWVSIHHGGGVGIGRSIHAGQVSVADGTALAAEKLARVLANDPAMGVLRHVDAGYPEAQEAARRGACGYRWARAGSSDACPRPAIPPARPLHVARESHVQDVSRPERGFQDNPAATGAAAFDRMWADLAGVGRHPGTGGYRRFAWTREDADLREWFTGEAAARGLDVVDDRAGNLWAWWGDPDRALADGAGPGVVLGSHLDSVPDGGAFDGPLGVVSALAAVDALRHRGFTPARPLGVALFGDEEGARFGVACAGSRLLTGALTADRARGLTDADGVSMAEALTRAGRDPGRLGRDEETLRRVGTFVELHVEQGRGLDRLDRAVAVGSGIWPHGRWRIELPGEANHAGTTALDDRHDAMVAFASAVLAARGSATWHDALATCGKVVVAPNGVNAIPSRVTAWLDARAPRADAVRAVVEEVAGVVQVHGGTVTEESWTDRTAFDAGLAQRLAALLGPSGNPVPLLATGAGHDAGILAAAGVPTAMLFVRNPTGISHSPAENAERDDCLAGVEALTAVAAELAGARRTGTMRRFWAAHALLPGGRRAGRDVRRRRGPVHRDHPRHRAG